MTLLHEKLSCMKCGKEALSMYETRYRFFVCKECYEEFKEKLFIMLRNLFFYGEK